MFSLRVRESHHGPFFNGQAAHAVREFTDEIEQDGAEWALSNIKQTYHTHFKIPTGYYESHVKISNLGGDPVVNDGGIIAYGPWLEGVGSRNNTTRFRGYHAFRKAAMRLEARFGHMGESLMNRRYIRRMN